MRKDIKMKMSISHVGDGMHILLVGAESLQ